MNGRLHFLATLAGLRGGQAGSRRGSWRHRAGVLCVWFAGFSVLVVCVPNAVFAVQAGSAAVKHAAGTAASLDVVPEPVSARIGSGRFTLTRRARIVAVPGPGAAAELPVAG